MVGGTGMGASRCAPYGSSSAPLGVLGGEYVLPQRSAEVRRGWSDGASLANSYLFVGAYTSPLNSRLNSIKMSLYLGPRCGAKNYNGDVTGIQVLLVAEILISCNQQVYTG